MSGIETRMIGTPELRVISKAGEPLKIGGYAAVFDKRSVDLGGWYEEIAPGAFTDTLAAGDDVRALLNHNPDIVLGRSKSGTLVLSQDDKGLYCEITLPDTEQGRSVAASIERGDITQMSFAFRVLEDKWRIDGDESYVRRLLRAKLYDVSPATYAAYPDTSVGVRSGDIHFFGEIPVIPDEIKRALASSADDSRVQVHLAELRRRVDIAEVE